MDSLDIHIFIEWNSHWDEKQHAPRKFFILLEWIFTEDIEVPAEVAHSKRRSLIGTLIER